MSIILIILLFLLMSVIGGNRGAQSFISICLNILVIGLMILLLYMGLNTYFAMALGGTFICIITLFYQNERNEKTIAAMCAVVITALICMILSIIVGSNSHIAGFNEIETVEESMYYSDIVNLNMKNIAISVVIIGMLGAVIDTAMSICSGVFQVYDNNRHLKKTELIKSGMNIGMDIMGSTINTLLYAYLGEAMMLMNYYMQVGYSFERVINSKSFYVGLLQIMLSGIGCIIVIPVSAIVISIYLSQKSACNLKNV